MFTGTMNAQRLQRILEVGLIPFINEAPMGHRLFQDNDLKHTSRSILTFFEEEGVNWWPTPPESPDLNPIENVWGSLKQYLRTTFKSRNLDELKTGIQQFWMTLTPEVCMSTLYQTHHKVIPKVIEVNGDPSGF